MNSRSSSFCDETFRFMPCTTSALGIFFLMAVWGVKYCFYLYSSLSIFSYAYYIYEIDGLSLTTFSTRDERICESGSCNMNKFGVPQLQSMEKFGATRNEIPHQLIELCCTDMSYFVLGSTQIIHGHWFPSFVGLP